MKIPWDFFAKRRGHNLSKMISQGKFRSYSDYTSWCERKDVAPISEKEFKSFLSVQVKQASKIKKKVVQKETKIEEANSGNKSRSKASSRRRRTPVVKKS